MADLPHGRGGVLSHLNWTTQMNPVRLFMGFVAGHKIGRLLSVPFWFPASDAPMTQLIGPFKRDKEQKLTRQCRAMIIKTAMLVALISANSPVRPASGSTVRAASDPFCLT